MATVELAIYDLTMGMAKQMAAPLAGLLDGKSVEMVPHTGVRVFGREIVYAGGVLSQPIATVEAGMGRKPKPRSGKDPAGMITPRESHD